RVRPPFGVEAAGCKGWETEPENSPPRVRQAQCLFVPPKCYVAPIAGPFRTPLAQPVREARPRAVWGRVVWGVGARKNGGAPERAPVFVPLPPRGRAALLSG